MEAFTRFLVTAAIRILEVSFVFGMLGSALVVILAGIDDLREIFKKDISGKAEKE